MKEVNQSPAGRREVTGPLETERQARELPAVRAVYAAFDASPGLGRMAPHNHRMLCEAAAAAGVELGAYDHRIMLWLAGWEPTTCIVLAGLIRRAAATAHRLTADGGADAGPAAWRVMMPPKDKRLVLEALDLAADYKRDRAATCSDCDSGPADLCGHCEARLARAADFDAIAARLGGAR